MEALGRQVVAQGELVEQGPAAGASSISIPLEDPARRSRARLRSFPTGRDIGRRLAAAALLAALTLASAGESESPEARILALLERAEERDVKALREMISERYADEQGRDKAALKALLAFHFLRNQSVHLLTRAGDIALPTLERAEVVVFVAMISGCIRSSRSRRAAATFPIHAPTQEFATDGSPR